MARILLGNIKGPQGPAGPKGEQGEPVNIGDYITRTLVVDPSLPEYNICAPTNGAVCEELALLEASIDAVREDCRPKITYVSGTTSSNGFFSSDLLVSEMFILGAYVVGGTDASLTFVQCGVSKNGTNWGFRLNTGAGGAVASTAVQLRVAYIDLTT